MQLILISLLRELTKIADESGIPTTWNESCLLQVNRVESLNRHLVSLETG